MRLIGRDQHHPSDPTVACQSRRDQPVSSQAEQFCQLAQVYSSGLVDAVAALLLESLYSWVSGINLPLTRNTRLVVGHLFLLFESRYHIRIRLSTDPKRTKTDTSDQAA